MPDVYFNKNPKKRSNSEEQIHRDYIGKRLRCLIDGKDGELLTARTEGGRLVRFAGDDCLIGTYQNITITGATTWSLTGELTQ